MRIHVVDRKKVERDLHWYPMTRSGNVGFRCQPPGRGNLEEDGKFFSKTEDVADFLRSHRDWGAYFDNASNGGNRFVNGILIDGKSR